MQELKIKHLKFPDFTKNNIQKMEVDINNNASNQETNFTVETSIMNEQELSDLQLVYMFTSPTVKEKVYIIYIPRCSDILANIECDVRYRLISSNGGIIFDSSKNKFQPIHLCCITFVGFIMIFNDKPKYIKSEQGYFSNTKKMDIIKKALSSGFIEGIYEYKKGDIFTTNR